MEPEVEPSQPSLYSREHLGRLGTHAEVLEALKRLDAAESAIEDSLDAIVDSTERLSDPVDRLSSLQPLLASLFSESLSLHDTVSERALVADRISSKVRLLDVEQNRVKECMDRVGAVSEVKAAIAALRKAVDAGDWEAATRCVQRARAIDPAIVTSQFAEAIVPTADVPDPPAVALDTFTASLTSTFLAHFHTAATSLDEPSLTRYFKLFPLLGTSASAAGLSAYSEFVCTLITPPPLGGKPLLVAQVTSLLEQVARVIAQHQPAVDKHYGLGAMEHVVVARLNDSLDKFVVERILPAWDEEKRPRKLLAEAGGYRFSKLNELLNPTAAPATGAGPALGASLSKLSASVRERAGTPVPDGFAFGTSSTAALAAAGPAEEEAVDPRAADALLSDLAGLSGRWGTYRRFLWDRLREEEPDESTVAAGAWKKSGDEESVDEGEAGAGARQEEELEVVSSSKVHHTINELLGEIYLPLEKWYLRYSVEKAHAVDEPDLGSFPLLSSALDDAFYMLKKSLTRLTSTAHLPSVLAGCREVRAVLERDFGEVLRKRVEGIGKEAAGASSGMGGGGSRSEERERKEKEVRESFMVYLNDLDTAAEYVVRLVDETMNSESLDNAFFRESELKLVKEALEGVKASESRFRALLKASLEQVFNQLVRPKLRALVSDCHKDVSYLLDDERYAEAEFQDLVRKRFVRGWETLLESYRDGLTPSNFQQLFSITVNVLVRPYESLIRSLRFTSLGALRFDRDLRSIMGYLSTQTSFGVGVLRESFTRLQQIAVLLEQDAAGGDDVEDFVASSEINWRLTASEIKAVLALRV